MTDIVSQYGITAEGAGWAETPGRGRLRFEGRDRIAFLQALLSNDVASLEQGRGVYAVYLTPQGRMLADLKLYDRGEYLIADVPAGEAASLAARLDGLIFTEDVRVSNVSASVGQFTVVGDGADVVLARAFALEVDAIRALPVLSQLRAGDIFMARTDDADLPSYDVFVDSGHTAGRRKEVIFGLEAAGAVRVSVELLDALRIEAGRPAFGRDMTNETIPLEAGLLDRAISTTKGCYVGQEVIVRVLHRGGGRVVKRLVKLVFPQTLEDRPQEGAVLTDGDREVGRLTSVAFSPARSGFVALGYVHRDSSEPGRHVTVAGPAGTQAEIVGFAA
ncbi:MAG TPA: glycine cleavage T C-terminal barrel domain-containing protein [Vicinamibacterales bacterium]|nr:glycine cleavage T C-terminal barrel domain-containing protein [Vicinamibacterales bacterium]